LYAHDEIEDMLGFKEEACSYRKQKNHKTKSVDRRKSWKRANPKSNTWGCNW